MASDLSEAKASSVAPWRDKKRYLWLMGLIVPDRGVGDAARSCGRSTSGAGMRPRRRRSGSARSWSTSCCRCWTWRFGPDGQNPPDEVMERLENDKYYRYCTYSFIPFQYATVVLGAYLFTAGPT